MADSARVAQAQVREVPVTVQGSKIVAGSDRREIFTETTKTTLVFDDGAALNLQSRVTPGQSVFLRNELSGREVLCRVLEAPSEGQAGPTELEFTIHDPEFWEAHGEATAPPAEQPAKDAAPAAEKAQPEQHGADAAENTLAMMSASTMTVPPVNPRVGEELVPAHEAVPASPAPPSEPASTQTPGAPPHDEIVPAHAQAPGPQPSSKLRSSGELHEPEFNAAKFEQTLAALLDGDARRAKRAAAAKEKEAAKQTEAAQAGQGDAGAAEGEAEIVVIKPTLEQRLTRGKGAKIVGACASAVIAVCLFYIWRAVYHPNFYYAERPIKTAVASKQQPPTAPARPAAKAVTGTTSAAAGAASVKAVNPGGAPTKTPGASAGVASAELASKAKPPETVQTPAIPVAKNSVAAPSSGSKSLANSLASPGPRVIVSRNAITADSGAQPNRRKPGATDTDGNIPARIVSEIQPAFPAWAKSLDVDGVVTLDATIDEKGNVTQTKVLSGPRPLQHAAEQAIGLWIFEPAQQGGKAVASHMTLTVEFQR